MLRLLTPRLEAQAQEAAPNGSARGRAAGQELTRTLNPSLSLTHEYDDLGRRTAQSVVGQDGRTLQRRGYSYRTDGYLTGIDDSLTGPRTLGRPSRPERAVAATQEHAVEVKT
ncbi:hypothetical protein [Streptomyces sp. NPDC058304]|uniref:hypothetical protein n=1 Tax=Streptomyces sp. NPDC058304 TaxID=3346437 RepID=UPI0036E62D83